MSYAEDLNLLGAEGLSGQFIVLRVRSIDKPKLAQALGGGAKGAAIPAALALVDFAPQQTLGLLMPMVAQKVKGSYGVDLDYQITEAPPAAPGDKPPQKAGGMSGKAVVLGVLVGLGGAFAASHFGVVGMARGAVARIF